MVDLFGELAGISFTPEGDRLYISISGGCLLPLMVPVPVQLVAGLS